MAACLMAYNGWSYVSFVAGEVKDPQRNLPRALALGMAVGDGAVRFGANLAYMHVLTVPEIAATGARRGGRWRRASWVRPERTRSVRHRAALDHRRHQWLHSDGSPHSVCAGAGRAVLQPLRTDSSAFQNACFRHCGAGCLERSSDCDRLVRDAVLLHDSSAWLFYTLCVARGVGAAAQAAGCPAAVPDVGLSGDVCGCSWLSRSGLWWMRW